MTIYRLKSTGEINPHITADIYAAWVAASHPKAEAYEAVELPPEPEPGPQPRSQPTRRVLDRLTDAEYTALLDSPVVAIKRAVDAARSEGTISEADPLFSSFVAGCDALGIIAASRWDDLLAD